MRSDVASGARKMRASATMSTSLANTGTISSSSTQPQVREHDREVERHADGDEEQSEQHVAERLDVLFHLVAIFGLRDQHAGEERAERQRQPERLGERAEAQRHQQHVQHEQLRRALPRDQVEPRAHRLLAEEQDHASARPRP